MAANKEEGDVIELGDSDSEHDEEEAFVEPMDTNEMVEVKLKTKEGKSNIAANEVWSSIKNKNVDNSNLNKKIFKIGINI